MNGCFSIYLDYDYRTFDFDAESKRLVIYQEGSGLPKPAPKRIQANGLFKETVLCDLMSEHDGMVIYKVNIPEEKRIICHKGKNLFVFDVI